VKKFNLPTFQDVLRLIAILGWLTVLLAIISLMGSCKKTDTCLGPGEVGLRLPGIVTWTNPVRVQIEVKGISWPGHAILTPNEIGEHRIEGHAQVRVKTDCSPWSNWIEINKP